MQFRVSEAGISPALTMDAAVQNDAIVSEQFRQASLVGGVVLVDVPNLPFHNLKLNPDPAGRKRASFVGAGPGVTLTRIGSAPAGIEVATNGAGLYESEISELSIVHHDPDPNWGLYHQGKRQYNGVSGVLLKLGMHNDLRLRHIRTPNHYDGRIANIAVSLGQSGASAGTKLIDCMLQAASISVLLANTERSGGLETRNTRFMGTGETPSTGLVMAGTALWDTIDIQPGSGFGDHERGMWLMGPTANVKANGAWFDGIRVHDVLLSGSAYPPGDPRSYSINGVELNNCWMRSNGMNLEVDPAASTIEGVIVIGGSMGDATGPSVIVHRNTRYFEMHHVYVGNGLQYRGAAVDVRAGVRGVTIGGCTVMTTAAASATICVDPEIPHPEISGNRVYGKPIVCGDVHAASASNTFIPMLAE